MRSTDFPATAQLTPSRSSTSGPENGRSPTCKGGTPEWTFPPLDGAEGDVWWRSCLVYQVYPLSFQDTDGDGRGDLPGLRSRVDYLSWLGVDAVWLSPVFRTPMEDFGYDISDFTDIDPVFGTLDDLDRLVEALHARGIRLILDFVPNHTSEQHPWFRESRSSRHSPRRDWYIWQDPGPRGAPPNNWLSRFGGSAWEWDERTGQYYYHAFLKSQPDLNWRNPEVRAAMHEVLRFWMRRGIDGFRVDAAAVLAEDARLRNDPPDPDFDRNTPPPERFRRVYTDARPESLVYLSEIRQVTDAFPGRVLLGEVDTSPDKLPAFYGKDGNRLHLPLNYRLLDTEWNAAAIEAAVRSYLGSLPAGACPDWLVGSHDKARIASKVGPAQARVAALLLVTLPGMTAIHSGDEIGMEDLPVPSAEARDPFEQRVPGYDLNRDPHRSPMRWTPGPKAGFTTGEPWLPIGDDVATCNVQSQRDDPGSLLTLYRALIALRGAEPALRVGSFQPAGRFGEALAYRRRHDGREFLIALNFGGAPQALPVQDWGSVRLSTCLDHGSGRTCDPVLRPNEGVIVECANPAS